ncbi:FAD-dependent monooxygenase [Modestobacter excelsi]|uniref:FAD-dependent monooxygenase n=1 Tax=Modestobacter excelsi TaxID=2213161 RepID=UPI00110CCFAC|nr:FAD-dependent monooxygenase [Modestobacter excelsi]
MTTTRDLPATTTVCIAGCGPAGAVLGLLLARAGIDVVVLEEHEDFLTDDGFVTLGDFTRLPGRFQCLSMVPQYELLDLRTTEAARSSSFALHRQVEEVGLVEEDGTVTGVRCRRTDSDGSEEELRALLTVAADGRSSAVRRAAGMSPVAGVGINLPVRDAAAANALVAPLRGGAVTPRDLRRVQRRRDLPTRVTQLVQRGVQRQMFGAAVDPVPPQVVPAPLRVMSRVPPMLPSSSRFMAIGIRNEHVAFPAHTTPAAAGSPR